MIIIREVFVAKPGQASKLAKMFNSTLEGSPYKVKVMTDMTGPFNTVVMETELENVGEIEKRMKAMMADTKMRDKMTGYTDMYIKGKREIYQLV